MVECAQKILHHSFMRAKQKHRKTFRARDGTIQQKSTESKNDDSGVGLQQDANVHDAWYCVKSRNLSQCCLFLMTHVLFGIVHTQTLLDAGRPKI